MNQVFLGALGLSAIALAVTAIAVEPVQAEAPFAKLPSGDQFISYYPKRAMNLGIEGKGVADCLITENLTLTGCTAVSENPPGYGFADATVKISRLFKLNPSPKIVAGAHYSLPINFRLSSKIHQEIVVTKPNKAPADQ